MHDTKERLSLLWIFALLNYLYADVVALFAIVGSLDQAPHLPPWALLGSAVLMEIPIAMIVACRLLPFRANRLANIIAGAILTLVNGFLTFVPPLVGAGRPLFLSTCSSRRSKLYAPRSSSGRRGLGQRLKPAVSSEPAVGNPELVAFVNTAPRHVPHWEAHTNLTRRISIETQRYVNHRDFAVGPLHDVSPGG